jgi:hypothetical protein
MREIKFRALVCFGYIPYKWIYYEPLEVPKEITNAEQIIVKDSQFTGLKDKNGVDIYEGDLIKISKNNCKSEILEVRYDSFYFYPFGERYPPEYTGTTIEVIDNIFENKELLKECEKQKWLAKIKYE